MRLIGRHITWLSLALLMAVTAVAPAHAQDQNAEIKQVNLTEAQVKGFISAQKDLADISAKLEKAGD